MITCRNELFGEIISKKNKKTITTIVDDALRRNPEFNGYRNINDFCTNFNFNTEKNTIDNTSGYDILDERSKRQHEINKRLRCSHIPYLETIPRPPEKQYVFGRVDEILARGYYECEYFKTLNLPYDSTGGKIAWNIDINDFFTYCASINVRTHDFEYFPIRLIIDKRCRFEDEGFNLNDLDLDKFDMEFYNKHCIRDYKNLESGKRPSVITRELCQLLNIYDFFIYKPSELRTDYDIYFLSKQKDIPSRFRDKYVKINIKTPLFSISTSQPRPAMASASAGIIIGGENNAYYYKYLKYKKKYLNLKK